jgi:hypothetical protein
MVYIHTTGLVVESWPKTVWYLMGVEDFVVRLLPILSNLLFLAPSARALEWEYPIDAFLWFFVALVTSPSYHLCMGFDACLWSVGKHRLVDFWSAELAMPAVALYFMRFRSNYIRTWFLLTAMIAIGLLVAGTDSSFMNQVIIGGISGAIVVAYLLWHRHAHGYWPEYDLKQLVLGLGFLVLGICFFVVQEWWPPYYGYTHSYWHGCDAIGIYFMIGIRKKNSDIPGGAAYPVEGRVMGLGSRIFAPFPKGPQRARFNQRGQPVGVHSV